MVVRREFTGSIITAQATVHGELASILSDTPSTQKKPLRQ
jgi:hypothetical protein